MGVFLTVRPNAHDELNREHGHAEHVKQVELVLEGFVNLGHGLQDDANHVGNHQHPPGHVIALEDAPVGRRQPAVRRRQHVRIRNLEKRMEDRLAPRQFLEAQVRQHLQQLRPQVVPVLTTKVVEHREPALEEVLPEACCFIRADAPEARLRHVGERRLQEFRVRQAERVGPVGASLHKGQVREDLQVMPLASRVIVRPRRHPTRAAESGERVRIAHTYELKASVVRLVLGSIRCVLVVGDDAEGVARLLRHGGHPNRQGGRQHRHGHRGRADRPPPAPAHLPSA